MVSKLEILLFTSLMCSLIALCYFAFFKETDTASQLANVINRCNAIHEERLVNYCHQSYTSPSDWDIRDQMDSFDINKTLSNYNLTIDTGQDRLNRRLNQ